MPPAQRCSSRSPGCPGTTSPGRDRDPDRGRQPSDRAGPARGTGQARLGLVAQDLAAVGGHAPPWHRPPLRPARRQPGRVLVGAAAVLQGAIPMAGVRGLRRRLHRRPATAAQTGTPVARLSELRRRSQPFDQQHAEHGDRRRYAQADRPLRQPQAKLAADQDLPLLIPGRPGVTGWPGPARTGSPCPHAW